VSATPQESQRESLPSGTVTFVFTDIEGSTVRWERDRAAMQAAVRRHDEVMRAAIRARNGHVFKTIGDAFCAAFARPQDAVAAMLDAQLALATEDFSAVDGLRVRAAAHVGTADERDGDYFGPAVNRVARLLGIAHGGQVLLSGTAAELVNGALPAQASLRALGKHRLKDLARAENVYQLEAPGLAAEFPALRSLDVLPNNLPAQLTSFVGREEEIAELTALIGRHRLVTLVGSGGVGKTRTSLQVAAQLLDASSDGVWFVELAPLTSGDYIPTTIAAAMGIKLSDGEPLPALAAALKAKRALLILDNCEHLVDASARAVAGILQSCAEIRILASTRQPLGIAGEQTYRMPSLDSASAVELFVERAVSVDPSFELSEANAPIVADICRRLDGIALAIELAAARVRILSPRQLSDRLDERFRILTGGKRDALPRQQTLRALIDWSYDLLDERERLLFRRLGIFVNGFTLEAASAVGSGENLDELDVFDVLASLVDKSLVLTEPEGDSLRYRLLESTRTYAAERLADAGERTRLEERHLRYLRDRFMALGRRAATVLRHRNEVLGALASELEDVRFALERALLRSDTVPGAEILNELVHLWRALGLEAEGLARNEAYLAALPASESRLLAHIACTTAYFLELDGARIERAFEVASEAVAHARRSGDWVALYATLLRRGGIAARLDRLDAADADISEAEELSRESPKFLLGVLDERAYLSAARGDFEAAAKTLERVLEMQRKAGNTSDERTSAVNLAELLHMGGHTGRAIAVTREYLPALRSGSDGWLLGLALGNFADYLAAVGDLPAALAAARETIERFAEVDRDDGRMGLALECLALVEVLRGNAARAATLEGYADAALARHGVRREDAAQTRYERLGALLRESLASEELARLAAAGAALTPDAAIAFALAETSRRPGE
jgi:predicted ATPase/class 3 adenylate cyclase